MRVRSWHTMNVCPSYVTYIMSESTCGSPLCRKYCCTYMCLGGWRVGCRNGAACQPSAVGAWIIATMRRITFSLRTVAIRRHHGHLYPLKTNLLTAAAAAAGIICQPRHDAAMAVGMTGHHLPSVATRRHAANASQRVCLRDRL